jgi:imidazolonepropionase-like amidohydrolase
MTAPNACPFRVRGFALALALLAAAAAADIAPGAGPVYFVGATLHPIESPAIPDGVLVVEDGRILSLGIGLDVPAGARTVDLAGKHVYPGFVHPGAPFGLVEINSVRGTVDTTEIGVDNAHLRAEVAFNGDSLLLAPAIAGGVLTAHVAPGGGLFAGTSAVMRLDGWNWQDMTIASGVGMQVHFPAQRSSRREPTPKQTEEFEKSRKDALAHLDEILTAARAYDVARAAAGSGRAARVDYDPALEALRPLLAGTVPVHLHAEERTQIAAALDWAAAAGLRKIVLVSGPDAALLADRLAREAIPVILDGVHRLPARDSDPYDAPYTAAARLHAAGVKVAIGDGGDAANARNLPFQAAMAAAFGLPEAVALRSITLTPAEILGVADRVGSLGPGKEASFFAADGDALEVTTRIERVWVRGVEYDLQRDHQRRLWERYRDRPKPPQRTEAPSPRP